MSARPGLDPSCEEDVREEDVREEDVCEEDVSDVTRATRMRELLLGGTFLVLTIFGALATTSCAATTGGIHARMGYSESGGLRVVEVPEGPAERAGLREGDRITAIDGDPVRSMALEEVVERLRGEVGSEVEIEVVRDGELVTLVIVRAPYDR
jgi:carboxyl-terminal processing protease